MHRKFESRRFLTSDRSPLHATLAAAAAALLLSLAVVVPAAADPGDARAPELGDCEEVRVDAENKVAFRAYAAGVQIYRWDGSSWAFVAPEALLFADADGNSVIGIHYGGPTWEGNDGSKVVGTVLDRCPQPGTIAWLKLAAKPTQDPGLFHRVNFIQRINTTGGTAPAAPGAFVGAEARVPYTAEYYFYRAQR